MYTFTIVEDFIFQDTGRSAHNTTNWTEREDICFRSACLCFSFRSWWCSLPPGVDLLGKVRFAPVSCLHDDQYAEGGNGAANPTKDVTEPPPVAAAAAAAAAASAPFATEEEEELVSNVPNLTSTQRYIQYIAMIRFTRVIFSVLGFAFVFLRVWKDFSGPLSLFQYTVYSLPLVLYSLLSRKAFFIAGYRPVSAEEEGTW